MSSRDLAGLCPAQKYGSEEKQRIFENEQEDTVPMSTLQRPEVSPNAQRYLTGERNSEHM